MSEAAEHPRRRMNVRHAIGGSVVLLAVLVIGWYLTSDYFRDYIRHRLIAQMTAATGGEVEIGNLRWNLARLRVEIDNLTIHGIEGPGQAPLFHANHIDARLHILSLIGRQVNFRSLSIDSPSMDLTIYPDGRSNQPTPRPARPLSQRSALDPAFDVAIRTLSVRNGSLRINDRKIPFEISANDVLANVQHSGFPEFYAAKLEVGKFDTHWKDLRPFASAGKFDLRLYRNALTVDSGEIQSEGSQIHFAGRLDNFAQPSIKATYSAKLDLKQAGSISRLFELQAGRMESAGIVRYDGTHNQLSGKLQITDGAWNHPVVHATNISGTADFMIDQDRLQLTHILATALGGNVAGELTVAHWNAPPHSARTNPLPERAGKSGHNLAAREQAAKGRFEVRGLHVERIASLFATQRLPLAQLHPSGLTDGTVDLSWAGTMTATELQISVRSLPQPGPMPVTAHVDGVYFFRNHSLRIGQAELHTAASHLNAAGDLGSKDVDLEVGIDTTNIREMEPLLAANGYENLRVKVIGEGSFQGTISGHTLSPDISGHLRLTDFTTLIKPHPASEQVALVQALHHRSRPRTPAVAPIAEAAKPASFHWDSFDGYVTFGPNAASVRGAVLRSGSARFELAANSTLQNSQFTDLSQFHGSVRIRDARSQDVQTLLGISYPIDGTLNLEMEVNGTRLDPHGTGKLTLADGSAYGQPLQSLSTDLMLSGREARFTNFSARSDSAKAEGSGFLNVTTERFSFDVRGYNIDLLRFTALQTPKVKLTGSATFRAVGSGSLSEPVVDGEAVIHNVSLGVKHEGDLKIKFATHGEQMDLTAASQFVTASLSASGRIHLRGDFESDITAQFTNVDLQPFLVGIARGHSSIDGTFRLSGPLRYPINLNARLEIPRYLSEVETVKLQNAGPIVASYRNGAITVESFRLTGDGTDLSSSGTLRLTDSQVVNLRADGRANLKLLQSFNPEVVSYGQTAVSVQIGGTLRAPALRGRLTIKHAGVAYVDMPNGLSDLNGAFVFNENRLQVEQLTAHTGGGDLAIAGFIAYGKTVSFNLTATGKEIRIRYPEGVSANGDADLRLAGTLQNATLSGQVTINKFGLNPRFDFAYYLTRSRQVPTTPNPDSPLNNLHFDVHVVSTPELQVQTSLAKITGDVDLRLRGSAFRPSVLGRITIVEGDVTFNGTRYRLDRGDVLFTNPAKIDPVLDLEASARVSDYDISIGLHGTLDKLNTSYRSDPPLPTADVFALLAFGRTTDVSYTTPENNAYTESASSAVLGSALNAAVSSRVQKLFGASRIKIDPEVGGAENNPNARITVEQQVSGNITLTYITNLAQSAQQVIQFQYNVNRNVSIVGVRDEYGVVGFEVQVRQRKR